MKVRSLIATLSVFISLHGLFGYNTSTVMVKMRDGVNLATDYHLSDDYSGPIPAILIRTPYDKTNTSHFPASLISRFTDENGYALIIQDTRGTGDSEGIDSVWLGQGWGERQDGYDAVEWISEQPWCDGKVGMWGASAMGKVQYLAAGADPPHLECLFAQVASPYSYQDVYQGGEFRKRLVESWLSGSGAPYFLDLIVEHPCYDDFWERYNLAERWDSVHVPAYHVVGWYDIYTDRGLDAFSFLQSQGGEGARGNQKLLVGPWTHRKLGGNSAGELLYPSNAAEIDLKEEAIRWFDYWLKGEDNGIMDEPAVQYYQMGDPDNGITEIENVWITADTWPLPSDELMLYLHSDGSLNASVPETSNDYREYTYDSAKPVPTWGGRNLYLAAGPKDQTWIEDYYTELQIYTSEVLTDPVVVQGKIVACLWASSDCFDTDWSVRICDVYPDGRSMLVGDGILKARFCNSPTFETEELLVPDSIYLFEVDLWSSAITFSEGHSIRIAVASSNHDRFEVNPNTGAPFVRNDPETMVATNRIYCDAEHSSYISLLIPPSAVIVENPRLTYNSPTLTVSSGKVLFNLPHAGFCSVELFDVSGRRIAGLYNGQIASGEHTIILPELADGIYFVRLVFERSNITTKLVEIK